MTDIKCPNCEDHDAAIMNLHREYERRGKELGKSETREETLNDRITMLEEHLCLTEEKLAEADGALSICSASWGECNRILDETKAKLAVAVWRFEHFEKYGDTNEARDFAAKALAELKGQDDEGH